MEAARSCSSAGTCALRKAQKPFGAGVRCWVLGVRCWVLGVRTDKDRLAFAGKAVVDSLRSMYKKVISCNGHTIEIRHFGRIKVSVFYDGKEIALEGKPKPSKLPAGTPGTFRA